MDRQKERFVETFSQRTRRRDVAVFAAPACPSEQDTSIGRLSCSPSSQLDLDIDQEHDLISIVNITLMSDKIERLESSLIDQLSLATTQPKTTNFLLGPD